VSQVIPFPKASRISEADINNIKMAVEKAVVAHQVLAMYLDDICSDPRLEHLTKEELAEVLTAMLQQREKS